MKTSQFEDLANQQSEYFWTGKTRSLIFRINALEGLRNMINANTDRIIQALERDLKKPAVEAFTSEVMVILKDIDIALKHIRRWTSPARVPTPRMLWPSSSYSIPEPRGRVLIMGPWNYPFVLTFAPLVSALAAGNTVCLKPSELSVHSSRLMESLIKEHFDSGHISVVPGGVDTAEALLARKWDHIFFTGGTDTGKKVLQKCSETLTPVTLELGGKNPCIVDKDIPIPKAARRIAWGKFFNAGQTCAAPDYLWMHKSVKDDLLEEVERAIKEFFGSDPQKSPDYARIINTAHFRRLSDIIDSSKVAAGGMVDEDDLYVGPTILEDVNWESKAMQSEIFGPLLPVMEFTKLEEVITEFRNRPEPLTLYFFSRDRKQQKRMHRETRSGSICFNHVMMQVMNRRLPFGGLGSSGMGQYHGKAGFDAFSHYRGVVKKGFFPDFSLAYPPYTSSVETLKKVMRFFY
ncbi:aldehyde dehydrogenase family protein [Fibrobacterota bacterium]